MTTELEQAIINYDRQNGYILDIYNDDGTHHERLQEYVNAVKCFQQHDELGEFSIPQILSKFVGVWDNKEAYIDEVLETYDIEDKLQGINLPSPNGDIPMYLGCLDYDELWRAMSQLNTVLRGCIYISIDYYPPEADHRFYVYDMTK